MNLLIHKLKLWEVLFVDVICCCLLSGTFFTYIHLNKSEFYALLMLIKGECVVAEFNMHRDIIQRVINIIVYLN